MNLTNPDKSAFSVAIQLSVRSATTAVRFPCLFSVQWRTNNQKVSIETAKYSPQAGKTDFNEDLVMRTQIAFDKGKRAFLKKETQVQLNLISKSRPDQPKLVGRVTIDLAAILNEGVYANYTEFPLQFCSVNGSLVMSFRVLEKAECDISLAELELSCSEGVTLTSALKLANGSSSIKECHREQSQVSENAPVSKIRGEIQQIIKRQISPTASLQSAQSPTNQESVSKNLFSKVVPEPQSQTVEQKPATRSFKTVSAIKESLALKKSEITEDLSQNIADTKDQSKKSSFKKMGSISSEEGKINESCRISEDFSKQKLENDRLKMESDRYKQESEMYRVQFEKVKQDYQLAKLQIKQKKSTTDQSLSDSNHLRGEIMKTREELAKSREESVSLTLKLAQLREAHNKSLVQCSISERELLKMEGMNQKIQFLMRENQQLHRRSNSMRTELSEFQSRCEQLELQKADLKSTLNNLDQMHQQALSKCTEHEQALTENKGSFEIEMRVLKEHLKSETKQRMEYEVQIQQLNEQVERLINFANQFDEARHSWEITESLNKDEIERKNARVKELEENLITLDDRVRWLEGENELLTENCRKNREDYLKIKSQKQIYGETTTQQIKKYEQLMQELRYEKEALEGQVSALQELTSKVQQQRDDLKSGNEFQSQSITQLQSNLSEVALKNHELEQLVLNINELRDRQRQDSVKKERDFVIRVAQLEGNNQQLEELVQANAERVAVVEDELRGRENLIMRLQEGLRTQVERSQQLNNRVMYYIEKQERMKETVILLELQSKKVMELLLEQQAKQAENQLKMQQVQLKNAQLAISLQESIQYGKGLEQLTRVNQSNSSTKITTLSKELEKKTSEISQNKLTIENKTSKIKEIQQQYKQLQIQAESAAMKSINTIEDLKTQITKLESSLNTVQTELSKKSSKLQQLQGELSTKHNQLDNHLASIDRQTAEFERLCEQLRDNELNHEKQIQNAEERYLDMSSKYQELENAFSQRQSKNKEDQAQLEEQIKQLKAHLDAISKESTATNIAALKNEIKKKNEDLKRLEGQLKAANAEASKVPNLERSLKIKSIQLNSLKFKGKSDGYEGNELLRLKDQQISVLTAEKERYMAYEGQLEVFREKSEALATQLELIEEEKFNIESLSNQRALQLEEARDENKKLMDEITIIGERNGQLEKTLQQILSKQTVAGSSKGDAALKAEIILLKGQLKQFEQAKQKVYELEQTRKKMQEEIDLKEEEHMIALIDQQFKFTKNDSLNSNEISLKKSITVSNNDSKQIPNLATTYKSLKEIIEERIKSHNSQKLIELIQSLLIQNEQEGGAVLEKSRALSKQFQKLKVQILKSDGKGAQQRVKLMNLFRSYESMLTELIRFSQGGKN